MLGDKATVAVIGPVFQVYVVAPPAVNVTVCPAHNVPLDAVTAGKEFTVTVVV